MPLNNAGRDIVDIVASLFKNNSDDVSDVHALYACV